MDRITCTLIILYSMGAQAAEDSVVPKMQDAPSYALARCIALTTAGSILTAFSAIREDAEMPLGRALTGCCAGVSLYGLRLTVHQLRSMFATYNWDSAWKMIYCVTQKCALRGQAQQAEFSDSDEPISPVISRHQVKRFKVSPVSSSVRSSLGSYSCPDSLRRKPGSVSPLSRIISEGNLYGEEEDSSTMVLTYDRACVYCPANARILLFDINRSRKFDEALRRDGSLD